MFAGVRNVAALLFIGPPFLVLSAFRISHDGPWMIPVLLAGLVYNFALGAAIGWLAHYLFSRWRRRENREYT